VLKLQCISLCIKLIISVPASISSVSKPSRDAESYDLVGQPLKRLGRVRASWVILPYI